ncbi:hypothetical protein MIMGU_mgv11b018711mg [Erythranthe guttata]|uniref:Uncharacterized protein n=1 Tax=Erythranthe guttata TaxID=4155 RepID=A0A022R9W2_ERYGU|nr:hypothetical protein MIMGU_mgv11b018711mg [Erythranthe guttata]
MFLQIRNNIVHFSKNYSLRTRNSHFPFPLLSLVQFYSKSRVEKQRSPAIFELLLHKHNFCPEAASQVATCLTLTRLKTLEKFDSTLSFFKESGFSNPQLEKMLKYRPTLLSANPDKPKSMIKFVGRVDEMGINRSSKMFIHAIRVLSSMTDETWEQKLKAFKNLGFSDEDIVETFRKAPQVFSMSEEKMKKLKEILIASGKYDFSCVISHPTSLICSVENKYKPRLQVLGVLESRNLINNWPSFSALYKMPDESFVKKYVGPYLSEVGDLHKVESSFCAKNGL